MRFTIFIIFLLWTLPVRAGEVIIENNVSVSANSGGNTAEAGEIVQGTAEVEVEVETILNGEVVEDIQIHEESSSGTPVTVEKEVVNEIKGATTTTNIKVEVNANSEKIYEEYVEPKRVSLRAWGEFFERFLERLLSIFAFF